MKEIRAVAIVFVLALVAVLYGCGIQTKTEDFTSVPHRSVESSLVFESDSNIILGNTNLFSLFDSLLFIHDPMDSFFFTMYNLNTHKASRVVPVGQGPGEVLNPLASLSVFRPNNASPYLVVYDYAAKNQCFYNIDSLNVHSKTKYSYTFKVEDNVNNNGIVTDLRYLNDSISLATVWNVDTIFCFFKNGKKFLSYPDSIIANEMKGNSDMMKAKKYMDIINVSPCGKLLVRFAVDGGIIEAYRMNGSHLKKLFSHVYFYPETIENLRRYGYMSVCAFENKVYGLYSGKKMNEKESFMGTAIHVYDLNGTLLEILDLDVPVSGIQISNKGNILYAITNAGEKRIVSFDIERK